MLHRVMSWEVNLTLKCLFGIIHILYIAAIKVRGNMTSPRTIFPLVPDTPTVVQGTRKTCINKIFLWYNNKWTLVYTFLGCPSSTSSLMKPQELLMWWNAEMWWMPHARWTDRRDTKKANEETFRPLKYFKKLKFVVGRWTEK